MLVFGCSYQSESLFAAQAFLPIATHFSLAWSVCLSPVAFGLHA